MHPKILFALRGSISDLQNRRLPILDSPSPCHLERQVGGSVLLDAVSAYEPPFHRDDFSLLLEPASLNGLLHNLDLSQSVWQKGSNVTIRPNEAPAPDASFQADTVTWLGATGNSQLLQYPLLLEAAKTCTCWLLLQAAGNSRFGPKDVVEVVGDVAEPVSVPLNALNGYPDQWRILELQFTTGGRQPSLPQSDPGAERYEIAAVAAASVTVSGLNGVAANDLEGGQASFDEVPDSLYLITANSASNGGLVEVTVSGNTLPADGVTTSGKVGFVGPPEQAVTLRLYSESTASLVWGGAQLEAKPFRTSMIYQGGERLVRGATRYEFQPKDNVLAGLSTFGVKLTFSLWRGDGNLLAGGNFQLWVESGKLQVRAGSTSLSDLDELPSKPVQIFCQVAAESASIKLFVNGVLKAAASLSGFVADRAPLVFTSKGVRALKACLLFSALLKDGQPELGERASQEVGELFANEMIPAAAIAAHTAAFTLSAVTVPALTQPLAQSEIVAVNPSTQVISVADGSGFVTDDPVLIGRGESVVTHAIVQGVSGNDITLDTVNGVAAGDVLIKGSTGELGRAFVRFPFVPVDVQDIISVNAAARQVEVAASLSFTHSRAFVQTKTGQEVREVLIAAVDNTNNLLTLSDISGIEVEHRIAQPLSETRIPGAMYLASFLQPARGVKVEQMAENGIVLVNANPFPVSVIPRIEVPG